MATLGRRQVRALLPQLASRHAPPLLLCCFAHHNSRRGLVTSRAKGIRRVQKNKGIPEDGKSDALDARLPPLTLAPLRDIALLCGRNSSGTKTVLRADLEAAMEEAGKATATITARTATTKTTAAQRILSIDMGVRNLAYCLLHVDAPPRSGDRALAVIPKLLAWERLSLIGGEKETRRLGDSTLKADEAGAAAAAATTKPPASSFSPPAMAAVAARLIRDRLLPLAPTHVLIERQRFRSGGAAAVLEWTVRVNSLEAMLHGIFAYRQLDNAAGDAHNSVQSVQAVSPQRVSQFLLRGCIGNAEKQAKIVPMPAKSTKEQDIKDVKEAFVAGVLRSREPRLLYDECVSSMVDAYLLRWDTKQSRSRPKADAKATGKSSTSKSTARTQSSLSKIDDLADCVAQGLIWLEWEDNKAILRERGADALLTAKPLAG